MMMMTTALFSGTGPLLLFVAKATLVLIAALGATALLRRGTAGERHLVWLAALVGVLALPVLGRIPALQLGVLPNAFAPPVSEEAPARAVFADAPPAATTIIAAPSEGGGGATVVTIAPSRAPAAIAIAPVPAPAAVAAPSPALAPATALAPRLGASMLQTIAMVWAGVALALLAWLAFGVLQVRRIIATSSELTSPDWAMPLCEVADRLDLEQPPRLVMSERIEMAFACRVLAPTIVLPAAAENWTDDRRRAVLFHELAHVKRHDLVSHTLGRVACALYWFHPLVWAAARNLRNESEKACDDLVLSCGARASDYAQHLLEMVTSVRGHGAPVLGIPMARKKEFEGRMLAILDPAIRRVSTGRLRAATVIAGLGALSLTVAAVSPARAADEQSRLAAAVMETPTTATAVAAAPAIAGVERPAAAATTPGPAYLPPERSLTPSELPAFGGDKLGRSLGAVAGSAVRHALAGLGILPQQARASDTARVALLIKVLQTDADAGVRRTAAWGLGEAGTPNARAALAHALQSDSDAEVREMSAWALAESGGGPDASTALAGALTHDANVKVRRTAAWALGEGGRRADADALVSALSDSDAKVRETAVWALGEIGVDRAPPTLVNLLADTSVKVREITAWALGEIGDTAAVRPITRAFGTETDNKVKRMYLWSLSEIGTAPTELIESAMKSSDPELRRHAVQLLTGSGGSWPMPMPRPMPRPTP
jgi:beta-lactamase regulating signal transducer with metallopeptidase domain/HEAT repeat protein